MSTPRASNPAGAAARRNSVRGQCPPGRCDLPPDGEDVQSLPALGTPRHEECLRSARRRFGAVRSPAWSSPEAPAPGSVGRSRHCPCARGADLPRHQVGRRGRATARYGRPVTVALMTSPLTHQGIRARLAEQGREEILLFKQRMLPRLTPTHEWFREDSGEISLPPAGHGDFFRRCDPNSERCCAREGSSTSIFERRQLGRDTRPAGHRPAPADGSRDDR
jgi:UTP--glucose-1-phosphate uridylyltransferase